MGMKSIVIRWNTLTPRLRFFVVLSLLSLIATGSLYFAPLSVQEWVADISETRKVYPEVAELEGTNWSLQKYQTYFRELSDKKGALYASAVLNEAKLAPGIDYHLLGHTVGDMLYKQKGIEAMGLCTSAFRNACSHSVAIDIIREHGEGSLPEIGKVCEKAPGGKSAYTLCFHGLGHGVLAYTGYELDRAVEMCKQVGTAKYGNREYTECVGGTIMEIIAGVHDPVVWQEQQKKYLRSDDPLFPCNSDMIPAEAKPMCLVFITPHLFDVASNGPRRMSTDVFKKSMAYCDQLPVNDTELRRSCYSGFGKEYVVIAQGRDIRNVGEAPKSALDLTRSWCALAGNTAGELACNSGALASVFWGGQNPTDASLAYCELTPAGQAQNACYNQLAYQGAYYLAGTARGKDLCKKLPEAFQGRCQSK